MMRMPMAIAIATLSPGCAAIVGIDDRSVWEDGGTAAGGTAGNVDSGTASGGSDPDGATSALEAGAPAIPDECLGSAIVDACPAGSSPIFTAAATARCATTSATSDNLVVEESKITGQCLMDAGCTAFCELEDPCLCGIDELTSERVACSTCEAACGNGTCEPPETDADCSLDCSATCVEQSQRCWGDMIQACDLRGFWEEPRPCSVGFRCEIGTDSVPRCIDG